MTVPRRFLLLAPLAVSACTSLLPKQKYVPRINWPLQPAPPAEAAANPAGPVLLIRAITAAPGLDQQGLRSLAADGSVTVDYYNLWAANPADAVSQSLVAWMQASGLFSAVVTPGTRLTARLILEGTLTELIADPGNRVARAALSLVVIKSNPSLAAPTVPLTQVNLAGTAPLTAATPQAEADAMNAALASVLGQAVRAVGAYVT